MRKVKTDAIDAYQLCVLYYKEDFEPHKNRGIQRIARYQKLKKQKAERIQFYDKKKSEGKPSKVAIVACINKLLHWIYALLNRKETFQDIV